MKISVSVLMLLLLGGGYGVYLYVAAPAALTVRKLEVRMLPAFGDDARLPGLVLRALQEALQASPEFEYDPDAAVGYRAVVHVGDVTEVPLTVVQRAERRHVDLYLRQRGGSEYHAVGWGEKPEDLHVSSAQGVQDAVQILVRQRALEHSAAEVVVAALQDSDVRVRRAALERIAQLGDVALAPAVRRYFLQELQLSAALRAVGVLVELRDRAAVPVLIEWVGEQSVQAWLAVVPAIGTLGGEHAHAFLQAVMAEHSHAGVRALASEALRQLPVASAQP